ncbi:MAG: glycoside hydrolase family 43 protein [Eubacteriales bacterium]|nr:glycoside hydrolase family 43 protein [Eubacteriales bacterium]
MKIQNPILRGFNPDPSIVRVGEDYYVATSTFEWFPGVQIHHSKDLAHWRLLTHPLDRVSLVDLRGVGASQGVWAPCLTFADGLFYLVYTVVTAFYCNMYDTHNYLITAPDILGPWSEPVRLNDYGFDPSLFHDTDGRKYVVSMVTDHRVPKKYAGRLILQEYDGNTRRMVGSAREIYAASPIFLEGPHLFKRNGWYYLFAADTGTGEGHGQTVMRSRDVWGPYEMYQPENALRTIESEAWSVLTTRHHPDFPLQKCGHADLVETQGGEWYAVHLCGRPSKGRNPSDAPRFAGERRYPLGRETALQKMVWTADGWPVLANGTTLPDEWVSVPELPACPWPETPARDEFDRTALDVCWQSLRVPLGPNCLTLAERPGWLRLYGQDGLGSRFTQSLIAQRLTEMNASAETRVVFEPRCFKQMAGLILWYDHDNYLYLHVTYDEELGKVVTLLKAENKRYTTLGGYIPIAEGQPIQLGFTLTDMRAQFFYSVDGAQKSPVGSEVDATFLSDEACTEGWFTGTMVGLCCQDLTGSRLHADFDWCEVIPI